MNLLHHLPDVVLQEADLPHLAQLALQSRSVQSNPKPNIEATRIEALLRAAW